MNLDVPLYTQSSDFSCGSACVAMILKYYNFVSNLDRDLEIELWRETNAVEMKGAGRYGVCAPLSVRGLYPHIITDNPGLGLIERAKTYIKSNGGSEHYLEFFHDMQKRVCALNGTTQEIRKPELKDIRDALNADRVMMALVSTIIFEEEDEDIPHWIVITGEDNGILTVNNPIDDDSAKELISRSKENLVKVKEEVGKKLKELGVEESLINLKGMYDARKFKCY